MNPKGPVGLVVVALDARMLFVDVVPAPLAKHLRVAADEGLSLRGVQPPALGELVGDSGDVLNEEHLEQPVVLLEKLKEKAAEIVVVHG